MGRSNLLNQRDLVNIYRLIGECRDMWYDSRAWCSHLLDGLCRLIGGKVGVAGEVDEFATGSPTIVQMFSQGWRDAASHAHWQAIVDQNDISLDPLTEKMFDILSKHPRLVTRRRHELMPDRAWRVSVHFNEHCKMDGVDECLYSYQPLFAVGPTAAHVIEIHRSLGDRRFSKRDANLVEWLDREIGPMIGRQLSSACEMSISELPPRLQSVLQCLLDGDSERQAAIRLGLSAATVHEYVQAIYCRFGVNSRSQLMARWVRRLPTAGRETPKAEYRD